jgi:hypothetical protein
MINVDEWFQNQLSYMDNYYIKGGKAFLYHFQGVPTIDMDLVMTKASSDVLFRDATACWTGQCLQLEGYEPFDVFSITETKKTFKGQVVRSLFVNGMTIIDAIIVKQIEMEEVELSEDGVYYMEKKAFVKDLIHTYEDRLKKSRYLHSYPEQENFIPFFEKLERSKQRCFIALHE